jgi:predicted dehydrogenase
VHIACHVGSYKTLTNSVSRYQGTTFGALLLDYVHQPDAIFWLSGRRPRSVFASGLRGGHRQPTSDPDLVSVLYTFDDQFTAYMHLNYLQDPEVHRYDVIGSEESVSLDLNAGTLQLHRDGVVVTESFSTERDPVYEREHDLFIAATAERAAPESPIEQAILSLSIQSAALKSLTTCQPADVDYPLEHVI